MSTTACVGLKMDRCIRWIFVQWAGDLDWTGSVLLEYYNNYNRAKALVLLGDLSIVNPRLAPEPGEIRNAIDLSIGNKDLQPITVAFHRDCNRSYHVGTLKCAQPLLDDETIIRKLGDEVHGSYIYLFDVKRNQWLFGTTKELLDTEKAIHDAEPNVFYPLEFWRDIAKPLLEIV